MDTGFKVDSFLPEGTSLSWVIESRNCPGTWSSTEGGVKICELRLDSQTRPKLEWARGEVLRVIFVGELVRKGSSDRVPTCSV